MTDKKIKYKYKRLTNCFHYPETDFNQMLEYPDREDIEWVKSDVNKLLEATGCKTESELAEAISVAEDESPYGYIIIKEKIDVEKHNRKKDKKKEGREGGG